MSYVGMILQTSSNSVYNYQLKQNTTCLLQEVAAFFGLLGFGNTFDWGNPLAYLQVEQMAGLLVKSFWWVDAKVEVVKPTLGISLHAYLQSWFHLGSLFGKF